MQDGQDFSWYGLGVDCGRSAFASPGRLFLSCFSRGREPGCLEAALVASVFRSQIVSGARSEYCGNPRNPSTRVKYSRKSANHKITPLVFVLASANSFSKPRIHGRPRAFAPDSIKRYGGSPQARIARFVVVWSMPLASVMFPKLVQQQRQRGKEHLLVIVILAPRCWPSSRGGPVVVWSVGRKNRFPTENRRNNPTALLPWYAAAALISRSRWRMCC